MLLWAAKQRQVQDIIIFLNCCLAAPRLTFGHCRGGSLTHPMLITAFLHVQPKGHQEPRSEVGSLSLAKRHCISVDIVKKCVRLNISYSQTYFQYLINKESIPRWTKKTRSTSIFKKESNSLVTNYRPISVLPCFSRLLKRIMYNRLYKFLVENNILYQK